MNRALGVAALAATVASGCATAPRSDPKPLIVPPGTARALEFPGHLTTVLLEGRATEGDVAFLEFVVPPRSFGAPPHIHQDEDEYFYVLEGEIRFLFDDRTVTATSGTVAALTRGHLHAFWNASDQPTRLSMAVAPGKFASFFDDVVMELRSSNSLEPRVVAETITRVAKAYNITIYPDPVPAEAQQFLPR